MPRLFLALAVVLALSSPALAADAVKPNIIYILADDLGYGDVRCYNSQSLIATPHLDRLAAQGMLFTDAHTGSSVCTPTRYGILTGRYAWRTTLQRGVLGGYSPRLIEQGRQTIAALLRQSGYHTCCIGKWHLGMDWPLMGGGIARDYPDAWKVDYTKAIANGPTTVGFDRYFGISASLDMPPYIWIDNDKTQGIPTVEKTWIRKGPAHKDFDAIDVLPTLTRKAIEYIKDRAPQAKKGTPFFLYLPLASPHTPILPTKDWQGKSKLNAYGDFVMQTDDCVGQILAALADAGLAENTLVIVTSDNGCSPAADIAGMIRLGHQPSGPYRGHKADIYEGGHRVPFIVRWPGQVQPKSKSDQPICHTDLLATCAAIVGAKVPDDVGEDSVSILPAFQGKAKEPLREALVHHSITGAFAIRQGKWVLALCPGSGGWSNPKPGKEAKESPAEQLFDLSADESQKTNVRDKHPEVVAQLARLLQKYVDEGRSTKGKPQKNAVTVQIRPGKGKK